MGHRHDKEWMFALARIMPKPVPPSEEPELEPVPNSPDQKPQIQEIIVPPFYESTLLWGALSSVIALVSVYLGFALKDIRWFLALAWPFSVLVVLVLAKEVKRKRHEHGTRLLIILVGSILCGVGLWRLGVAIPPPPFGTDVGKQIDDAFRRWAPKIRPASAPPSQTAQTIPTLKPIIAKDFTLMMSGSSDRPVGFWLAPRNKRMLCLANAAFHMFLVNTDPSRKNMVRDFEIEGEIGNGRWVVLPKLPVMWGDVLWGVQTNQISRMRIDMLDSMLVGYSFDPGGVIQGWVVVEYPKNTLPRRFRATISDFTGIKHISDISPPKESDKAGSPSNSGGALQMIPPSMDLSSFPIGYCSDLISH